jgi:hypothetical protein
MRLRCLCNARKDFHDHYLNMLQYRFSRLERRKPGVLATNCGSDELASEMVCIIHTNAIRNSDDDAHIVFKVFILICCQKGMTWRNHSYIYILTMLSILYIRLTKNTPMDVNDPRPFRFALDWSSLHLHIHEGNISFHSVPSVLVIWDLVKIFWRSDKTRKLETIVLHGWWKTWTGMNLAWITSRCSKSYERHHWCHCNTEVNTLELDIFEYNSVTNT